MTNFTNRFRNFVKDQGGMEALQTVCIVAIAATILIAAAGVGTKGTTFMNDNFKKLKTAAEVKDAKTDTTENPTPTPGNEDEK